MAVPDSAGTVQSRWPNSTGGGGDSQWYRGQTSKYALGEVLDQAKPSPRSTKRSVNLTPLASSSKAGKTLV